MKQSQSSRMKGLPQALVTRFKSIGKMAFFIQSRLTNQGLNTSVSMGWRTQFKHFADQYQRQLIWIGVVASGLILALSLISPSTVHEQNNLLLRPTQWAYLQNLAKESQPNTKFTEGITRFDEIELQRLRTILANRGIKTSVLALTAGGSLKLEFQANEVMFSTLLDILDEMRSIWHIYPSWLNIHQTDSAGVVKVSGYFLQYSVSNMDIVEAIQEP